jgi:DNA polymerase delta subunit 1
MKVVFQHLDTQSPNKFITLFGRTLDDKSVAVHIKGFRPILYIRIDRDVHRLQTLILASLIRYKESKYIFKWDPLFIKNIDLRVGTSQKQQLWFRVVEGQDITDFNELGNPKFLEIQTVDKYVYNDLKAVLNRKCEYIYDQRMMDSDMHMTSKTCEKYKVQCLTRTDYMLETPYTIYNDQVDYGLQYLISKDIYSCNWMEVIGNEVTTKQTTCDIELNASDLVQIERDEVAPWHILTYDIESVPHPRGNGKFEFPTAENDPVCTIGGIVQKGEVVEKYVWIHTPNGDPIDVLSPVKNPIDDYTSEDTEVYHYDDELEMLIDFNTFIVDRDIDIIEGYNSAWFDHPYLFKRYNTLMTKKYGNRLQNENMSRSGNGPKDEYSPIWGRFLNMESFIREKVFESKQAGKNITKTLFCPGRIDHDGYQVMKKNHNLSSYKLDNVAFEFLGTKKYPMDYNDIHPKYHTKEGRDELAVYCVKDAWLTRKILHKLSKLFVSFQMACVTGIPINDVLNRGQGIRTIALMLRYCKKRTPQCFIPRRETIKKYNKWNRLSKNLDIVTEKEERFDGFKGAVVLDPKPKFYKEPIATLDFASLYPSVMQCMNMSYETIVSRDTMLKMGWTEGKEVRTVPDYYWKDGRMQTNINYDTNIIFATKETRQGILPEILDSLLTERRRVKKIMKQHHPDTVQYKIANGRQLGLKVCANSIYGFTGARVGFLPDKRIAGSVTKYGRGLTLKTQDLIENHPVWGKEHGVKCVYGDTDSVFCHLPRSLCNGKTPEETVAKAEEIGREMSEYVDSHFLNPIELEFEKVYLPFMLIKKKRYCGKKYEEGHVKIDMKGLECVRRDFCPLLVKTQKEMLTVLMNTMDVEQACKVVSKAMQDLALCKVPLEMLTMSKKLSRSPSDYKVRGAHVNLAMRINKERGEQHGFVAGDRVPYVIAKGKSFKMSENSVLPEEITSGKFVVDYDYYRNKQMIPPLTRIIEKLCDNPKSLFVCNAIKKPAITGMFAKWVKKRKQEEIVIIQPKIVKKSKKTTIYNFF